MTATAAEQARADLLALVELVQDGRRAVAGGHAVSLAPLGERTRAVCAGIAALDRPAARPLLPLLEAVLADLEALESELAARFGALALRQDHTPAPTVAAAYRAQAATGPAPRPPRRPSSPATGPDQEKP